MYFVCCTHPHLLCTLQSSSKYNMAWRACSKWLITKWPPIKFAVCLNSNTISPTRFDNSSKCCFSFYIMAYIMSIYSLPAVRKTSLLSKRFDFDKNRVWCGTPIPNTSYFQTSSTVGRKNLMAQIREILSAKICLREIYPESRSPYTYDIPSRNVESKTFLLS